MSFQGRVLRTERVTPHMTRVVLGGDGIRGFGTGAHTDHYVKLVFPLEGVRYPEPFDLAAVRRDMPRERWPRIRTYTVRRWDPRTGELSLDFVLHGERGLAGSWAAGVRPGEVIHFSGPGGGYAPRAEADWHLLVGDESALPAIAASLEAMPAGAVAKVFVEVSGPEEEQELRTPASADVVWLHRGDRQVGDALEEAVRALGFPAGAVQAFVHGEAHFVKAIRGHLRTDRGMDRDQWSISGYWRRGADEDGWQATKSEWNNDPD